MTDPQTALESEADDVERHECPRCHASPGSPCRSRSGAVAGTYHTGRFTKVPRLAKLLRVPTPNDRGPGQPWRPGTPAPAPTDPGTPTADIHIGYARCSTSPRNTSRSSTRSPDTASRGTRSSPRRSAPGSACARSSRPRPPPRERSRRTPRTAG
ncbi:zinc finger domain-containing protein [Streptomyces panacea]|uniref:zinc finger domain-containing protein n=1 Tax=Streptomyces panacea TaxID=3035064 RepID=UPI003F49CA77